MTDPDPLRRSPLGRDSHYPDRVDPGLLFAIDRGQSRTGLAFPDAGDGALPFAGEDRWTAWELSWLDRRGLPSVAVARLTVPARSPRLVESKSLKLYLNGYAGERFDAAADVAARIGADLASVVGTVVAVDLVTGDDIDSLAASPLAGVCLDRQDIVIDRHGPVDPDSLRADDGRQVEESLFSRLFRSNCPVTGQPDWADVQVRYRGPAIDHAGLLRYLVSFRQAREFHEQCVERIWLDLHRHCRPASLLVHARFTRRGGIDINPWRADDAGWAPPAQVRTGRQ